ncbi:DUF2280 domain-containing protein [Burkholderia multivorans]|nr:DUF2280 domain-containing protein [Burkholderia multivorans]
MAALPEHIKLYVVQSLACFDTISRVAKFRHGRTGDVPMTYCGEFVRFENHAGAWPTHTVQKVSRSRGFE